MKSPRLAPRPPVSVSAPALSIVRVEDKLLYVARGFAPFERATRSVRMPDGRVDSTPVDADSRGVVSWMWRLVPGTHYGRRDVEVRGATGACSGTYFSREK